MPARVLVYITPELTIEPLPTHYERRAQVYEFLRLVLEASGVFQTLRRVDPHGHPTRPLDEELADITALFRSAAAVARQELGMAPATDDDYERVRGFSRDATAGEDVRMVVPAFHDVARNKTKVWALLGWTTPTLKVQFDEDPGIRVQRGNVEVDFGTSTYPLATPVFIEAYVSVPPNRNEFRALCNQHRTKAAILRALESL